jgi:hypothetical protein
MSEWTSSRQLPANVRRLPPRPDLPVLPGWYTIDQPHNVQAYWNGFEWSRTRQWRGVGWLEHGVGLDDGGGDDLGGLSCGVVDGALGGQLTLVHQTPATGMETLTRPVPLPREPLPVPLRDQVTSLAAIAEDPATSSATPATSTSLYKFPTASAKADADGSTTSSPPIPKTNPMAIASLVLSVIGLLGVGSVLGIILGAKARRQVRMSHGTQSGDRLALAGIIVGICTLVIALVVITLWLIALANYSSHLSHLEFSPGSGS